MSELDEIREKKLKKLKEAQLQKQQKGVDLQQQVQQLEQMVKGAMTKKALERYGNIKAANEEKAVQVTVILAQLLKAGQIKKIDDQKFKEILKQLSSKKEIKIKRR